MRIEKLNQTTKKNLLEDLLKRSPNSYEMYEEQVKAILDNVKKRGDEALFEYTEKFDGFCLFHDTNSSSAFKIRLTGSSFVIISAAFIPAPYTETDFFFLLSIRAL